MAKENGHHHSKLRQDARNQLVQKAKDAVRSVALDADFQNDLAMKYGVSVDDVGFYLRTIVAEVCKGIE